MTEDSDSSGSSPGRQLDAILKLQSWQRGFTARAEVRQRNIQTLKAAGIEPAGSDDSRALTKAVLSLDGQLQADGVVRWPKGTVVKLLKERAKYVEQIQHVKRERRRQEEARVSSAKAAKAAVDGLLKSTTEAPHAANDPTWNGEDWIRSLELPQLVAHCLLGRLKDCSVDPRFERRFVAELGQVRIYVRTLYVPCMHTCIHAYMHT